VDTPSQFTAIEWCAGYGGIHLGLGRAIPNLRVIAYGEIEAFACANLVAKMEAGLLDPAPLWTDIKTFPCEAFRDRVDLLVAGYPCQPFSAAGKRLGAEDPRHLWPYILRAVGIIRPRLCFFENVEGHISLGLREVLGDLGAAGYTAAWGIFSASEVGAPHQRKRIFILAYRHGERGQLPDWWREPAEQVPVGYGEARGDGRELVNAQLHGRQDRQHDNSGPQLGGGHSVAWPSRPGEQQFVWEPPRVVADSKKSGRLSERIAGDMDGEASPEGSRGNQFAPTITDCGVAGAEQATLANDHRPHAGHGEQWPERTLGDLSGGCGEEAMGNASQREDHGRETRDMGLAPSQGGSSNDAADCTGEGLGNADHGRLASGLNARSGEEPDRGGQGDIEQAESGKTQPPLGRDADGPAGGMGYAELQVSCDNRTDELRLLGNGVVPATAERAFRVLMQELLTTPPKQT
jgi:DNA (cytosine-5)-methyltransferase 1